MPFKQINSASDGFSLLELLIVMVLLSILTTMSFIYLNTAKEIYNSDNQALSIIDILQEARQRSLTQRETLRVELDLTDNVIRLIDENKPNVAADDIQLKEVRLLPVKNVRIDQRPSQIDDNPPEEFPVPSAYFVQSIYPGSLAHDVCTIRFQSNGKVVDQGTNEVGANALSTGLTIHIWSPKKTNEDESDIARAITIIGSTGAIRLWEHDKSMTTDNKWKDTRRTSSYGGQTSGGGESNKN